MAFEIEPELTKEEKAGLDHSLDILLEWLNSHRHGNPFWDGIQASLARKRLREKWKSEIVGT